MGTEVTISFLLTCGVLAGFEAMKAAGWRIWAFSTVAAIFIVAGLGWVWLKEISPPVATAITQIAESPQSWFLLLVVALTLVAITGRQQQQQNTDLPSDDFSELQPVGIDQPSGEILDSIVQFGKQIASLTAKTKNLTDASEAIRNLDRTAFLLATSVVESLTKNELQKCLAAIPVEPPPGALNSNEDAGGYITLLNKYFRDAASRLSGSNWGNLLMSHLRTAEQNADFELRNMQFPPELHPQTFRSFHIACVTRRRVQEFLERAIAEAEENERQMLQMVRDRPEIHSPPRR